MMNRYIACALHIYFCGSPGLYILCCALSCHHYGYVTGRGPLLLPPRLPLLGGCHLPGSTQLGRPLYTFCRTSEFLAQPYCLAHFSKTKPILGHYRRIAPRPHNVFAAGRQAVSPQRTNSAASLWTSPSITFWSDRDSTITPRTHSPSRATRSVPVRTFRLSVWVSLRPGSIRRDLAGNPRHCALTTSVLRRLGTPQVGEVFPIAIKKRQSGRPSHFQCSAELPGSQYRERVSRCKYVPQLDFSA